MKFAASLVLAFSLISLAFSDDNNRQNSPYHFVMAFYGQSAQIFGSEDNRVGGGIAFGFGQPEKRFTRGKIAGQLVYEGYIDHTQSGGANGLGPDSTFAGGVLAYGRWVWPLNRIGNGVYFDLGAGIQMASQTTLDLESELNSTPVADIGGIFKDGNRDYLIGLRLLHISNAGFVKPNFGQNEVFFTLGFRY